MKKHMLAYVGLLLAAPLSAQEVPRVSIVPAEQTNNIFINLDSLGAVLADLFAREEPDTAAIRLEREEAAQRAEDRFAEILDAMRESQGGSVVNVTSVSTTAIALILTLIYFKMDGSNGEDGAAGARGEPGQDGATGPTGPAGQDGDGYGEG